MTRAALVLLPLLGLVACKSNADTSKPAPKLAPVTIDPAAVNALVPANLKDKLVFEKRTVEEARGREKRIFTLAAPASWKPGEMSIFAKLRAPDADGFGNSTEIGLSSNCDGRCEPKDWDKVVEKVEFAQFRDGSYKILKDEASKTDHMLVAQKDSTTHIRYAWWADGGSNYLGCSATLDKGFAADESKPDIQAAAPAFQAACKAVTLDGD